MEREPAKHRPLQVWLVIILGSIAFSGFIMAWNPTVTGLVAFDAGPTVNLNPDLVAPQDYYSSLTTAAMAIFLLIGLQVGVYFMVTRFYEKLEEPAE